MMTTTGDTEDTDIGVQMGGSTAGSVATTIGGEDTIDSTDTTAGTGMAIDSTDTTVEVTAIVESAIAETTRSGPENTIDSAATNGTTTEGVPATSRPASSQPASSRLIRSPIIRTVRWMLAAGISGIRLASTTCNFSTPWTRP